MRWLAPVLLALLFAGCQTSYREYHYHTSADNPNAGFFTVELPPEVQLLAINGAKAQHSMLQFTVKPSRITLTPGETKLEVRYQTLIGEDDQPGRPFRSSPVTLELTGKNGDHFTVQFKRPRSLRAATRFARNPEFWIE